MEQVRKGGRARVAEIRMTHGEAIASDYTAGATLKDLARRYDISLMTVRSIALANGATMRETGNAGKGSSMRSARQIRRTHGDEIQRLYEAGATLQEIGDQFDVALGVVRSELRARGVAIRKRGWGSVGGRYTMENNPQFRGGRVIDSQGYVRVLLPPDSPWLPMASTRRYVPEHRLVMAQTIHRLLEPDETVHHIDGDRTNNAPSNLQLRQGKHGTGVHHRCAECGSTNVVATHLAG